MQPEDDAPEIAQRAFAALAAGDLDQAQALALRLKLLRYSAYFELEALISLEKGEIERAIAVLREGVEVAPDVWLLWQLLGNSLSDNSQFDEALRCYERALELDLDEEERASLSFNQATLLARTKREKEALAVLDSLAKIDLSDDSLLRINIELLRISVWASSNRCDEVGVRAAKIEELLRGAESDGDDFRALSQLWSRGAATLLECGFTPRARSWAQQALEAFVGNAQALEILRLSAPKSPLAKRYFQVLLEGEEGENGFFISYSVVARDANEAQKLALEMESPRHEKALVVSECKPLGKCDKTPIGVYDVGVTNFFPLDAQDD